MIFSNETLKIPYDNSTKVLEHAAELADNYLVNEYWGSSHSVFKAVLELYGISFPSEILRLLSSFTGGVGLSGEICGALSGGLCALGYVYGSESPRSKEKHTIIIDTILSQDPTPQEKAEKFINIFKREAVFNKLITDFRKEYGYVQCKKLISPYEKDPICRKRFGMCRRLVSRASALTAKIILDIETTRQLPLIDENIYSHLIEVLKFLEKSSRRHAE